jgi:pimeloyl-ACP methyl ester carboxylesterase/DNA-binding CsgD family transcriptional regulator
MAVNPSTVRSELRFVTLSSGARIAWAESGRSVAGQPPLVRAAHWMTHVEHDAQSPLWQPWLTRLGRSLRVVRYDERGCGSSSGDDTPPGLAAATEELAAVVDACGSPRVALLGLSGSCAAAVAYAARHPERVSHLVLHGGYTHGLLHREPSADALAYHRAQLQLMALGWGRHHSAVQQFFTSTLVPEATPEQAAALNEQQRLSCDGTRAAAILDARAALDVRAFLPQVRCPTLVLHCDGDAMVPVDRGRELAAAIAGARFETLRSRNHIPLAGEAAFERFCDAITDFVNDSSPAPAPDFTRRERELLDAVARGLDNLQIAAHLGVANKTVRNALSQLYAKLGVEGRPQAIVRAREMGYGQG